MPGSAEGCPCDSGRRNRRLSGVRMLLSLLRFHGARSGAAGGAASERQQRDVAGALDGDTEPALMACAHPGHAARQDFAAFLDELRKNVGALVVDQIDFLNTKLADLLLAEKLALAAAGSAGTARAARTFATSATGTAFAARSSAMAAFMAGRLLRSRGRLCLRSGGRWRFLILFV